MITIKGDTPICSLKQDEFGRKTLVNLIVEAIKSGMTQNHPAMTIGVYGAWGEGKTSLMQMVKTELDKAGTNTIWYNPWFVADEKKILMEFFSQLSSIAYTDEAIPTIIENYGRLFILPNENSSYSPVVASYLTRLSYCITVVGKNMMELKANISKRLRLDNKYPVVFIDDVDRLSKNEIRIVFKLLRQIADFDNVTYVVGLDPAAVASALDSTPSSEDNVSRGRAFLEKIIQVPIVLPSIDEIILQDRIKKMLLEVASDFDIVTDSKSLQLVSETLSPVFTTKRSIVRLGNQLRFVLPVVHKETEFVDLCLIESLKYINEQGWLEIARQKNNLLGEIPFVPDRKERDSAKSRAYNHAISAILSYYYTEKKAYVEEVLRKQLFPQIHHYGINTLSKAINNKIYFSQYFICGVPEGVIARSEAEKFAKYVWGNQRKAILWTNQKMKQYTTDEIERTSRLTLEMVKREDSVEMAAKLCRVLSFSDMAKKYTKFPASNPTSIDTTITVFVIPYYMVKIVDGQRVPDRKTEAIVLKEIFGKAPLNYCMNLFYGIYSGNCSVPDNEKDVFDVLKLRVLGQGKMSVFDYSYFILQKFLLVWKRTTPGEYTSYMASVINDESFDAGSFVVRSLEANSTEGQIAAVAAITDLFTDVWDPFMDSLNKYSDKDNKLFKLFVFNCNNIRKEHITISEA